MTMDRPVIELDTAVIPATRHRKPRPYLQAVAVYVAVRALGVAVLALMAGHADLPLLDRLTAWDGVWYTRLADVNYVGMTGTLDAAGGAFPEAPYAFFPLYPAFTHLISMLPGVSTIAAGLLLSLGAGIATAGALVRIGRLVAPERPHTGLILTALFAGAPMGIVLSMTYTESMFCALAAWALVAVLERQWLLAAACCFFAGLTRSTATVLIVVVVAAAVIEVWRGRDRRAALLCAVVAPLGLAGYWAAVAAGTGMSWQAIELRGWDTRFDGGQEAIAWVTRLLLSRGSVMETTTVGLVLGAVVLAVLGARRMPWPLALYGAGVVALVVCTAGLPFIKARLLLPAMFVLLIPVAVGLANRRPKTAAAVVVGLVLVGAWVSGHSLTAWQYAI
jgi:hypothetical protein